MQLLRLLHLDAGQGASEARTESYIKYGKRALQLATRSSAKSTSGVTSSAWQQAGAVQET